MTDDPSLRVARGKKALLPKMANSTIEDSIILHSIDFSPVSYLRYVFNALNKLMNS